MEEKERQATLLPLKIRELAKLSLIEKKCDFKYVFNRNIYFRSLQHSLKTFSSLALHISLEEKLSTVFSFNAALHF